MKLKLNHIEICTRDPIRIQHLLQDQFRFQVVGSRETGRCSQTVLQSGRTVFIVTFKKSKGNLSHNHFLEGEPWTNFCCHGDGHTPHIDSVFNVALCVENLTKTMLNIATVEHTLIQAPVTIDGVKYAIVSSICGDVVHTLIEKGVTSMSSDDWWLPGFTRTITYSQDDEDDATTHLDHIAFACRTGESTGILDWYEKAFGMRRFLTNRNDDIGDGLVIGGEVSMRLKVMAFWKCDETGLAGMPYEADAASEFKLVISESLPQLKNLQIEGFLKDHNGPGLQHIGLHTSNMVKTVERMSRHGVKFRHPPPTYYTEVGQLEVIREAGENIGMLRKYGILLDNEADPFDEDSQNQNERYLMQIFTYPIFNQNTFFFEVIQRKGATGFGIGNVTALARSIAAHELELSQFEN